MFIIGDTFTIADTYRRRTFWQWLTRTPRVLETFTITLDVTSTRSRIEEQIDAMAARREEQHP